MKINMVTVPSVIALRNVEEDTRTGAAKMQADLIDKK